MVCGRATSGRTCPHDGAPTLSLRPAEAELPREIDGHILGAVLGRGGMGLVFEATAPDGSEVALKLLHPERARELEQVQRFFREATAARRIDSPRVVRVLGIGVDPETERPYLVMECVRAPTLAEVLARGGPWPLDRALALLLEVAEGLAAAHAAGVVHRDVKPANLFVTAAGARISDFGIAQLEDAASLTSTGVVLGTTSYMAPEQLQGTEVDGRADVYALGCVLHAILRGRAPFESGEERGRAYLAHVYASAPPLLAEAYRRHPPWSAIEALSRELLAKMPEDRPTAAALCERLAALELAPTGSTRERGGHDPGAPSPSAAPLGGRGGARAGAHRVGGALLAAEPIRGGARRAGAPHLARGRSAPHDGGRTPEATTQHAADPAGGR